METVSIRNLRGKELRAKARSGKPLAITNHRALIGVLIPVAAAWVELLIDYNWSQVHQSIVEGEQAISAGTSLTRIDDVTGPDDDPGSSENDDEPGMPERLAVPLVAALTGGALAQAAEGKEALQQLQAALAPPKSGGGKENSPAEPSVRTVRIGDLSAALIQEAGDIGQTLALTHDRELIGMVIPVTQGLVEFLIEQNVSRVLQNISLSDKQIRTTGKLTTLDEALDPPLPGQVPPSPEPAAPSATAALPDAGPATVNA